MEYIICSTPPVSVFGEFFYKALQSQLDTCWLLECNFDGLLENHVRAIVHLNGAKEHSKLVVRDLFVKLGDDKL